MKFDIAICGHHSAVEQLHRTAAVLLIVIGLGMFYQDVLQTGMNISFKAMMPSGKKLNVATRYVKEHSLSQKPG